MEKHYCICLSFFRTLAVAAIVGLLLVSGNAEPVTAQVKEAPDYILVNGKIFTADTANPYAQALAITGERILSVGTSEEISRLASPHTIRIDLHGRLVIPGINDAHYHFLPRPVAYQLVLKGQEPTWDEVKEKIAAAVIHTPTGTLINGVIGLSMLDEPEANRTTLDHLAPDHPVQLACYWGHCSIFNSAFMRKAGIGDKEPDPPGGITLATLREESPDDPSNTPTFVSMQNFRNSPRNKCNCRMQSTCSMRPRVSG